MAEPCVTAAVVRNSAPFSITNLLAALFTPPKFPTACVLFEIEDTTTVPPEMRVPPV